MRVIGRRKATPAPIRVSGLILMGKKLIKNLEINENLTVVEVLGSLNDVH
jgi:hypothetical protein